MSGVRVLHALLSKSTPSSSLEDIRDVYTHSLNLVSHEDRIIVPHMSDKQFAESIINSIKRTNTLSDNIWVALTAHMAGNPIKKELANKPINEPEYAISLHSYETGYTVFTNYRAVLKQILAIPTVNNGTIISFDEWIGKVKHICQLFTAKKMLIIDDTSPYIKDRVGRAPLPWMLLHPFGYNGDGEFSDITFGEAGYTNPETIKRALGIISKVRHDTSLYNLVSDVIAHASVVAKSQHSGLVSMFAKDKVDPNGKKIAIALLGFLAIIKENHHMLIGTFADDVSFTIEQAYGDRPYHTNEELAKKYGWH